MLLCRTSYICIHFYLQQSLLRTKSPEMFHVSKKKSMFLNTLWSQAGVWRVVQRPLEERWGWTLWHNNCKHDQTNPQERQHKILHLFFHVSSWQGKQVPIHSVFSLSLVAKKSQVDGTLSSLEGKVSLPKPRWPLEAPSNPSHSVKYFKTDIALAYFPEYFLKVVWFAWI